MKRFFPHPLISCAVFIMWLILAGTYSQASFAFAAVLALIVPQILRTLEPEPVRIKNITAIIKLTGIVFCDIIRSNIAVAKIVLGGKKRERVSGFVHIPLTMKNTCGLAVLGIIITSTPGTLWVQYDSRMGVLLLHVLDLVDEEYWIKLIQSRYERLLMEIFE